jgi:restriction endonuclease S subunit
MNGGTGLPGRENYPIVPLEELCDMCSGITKGRKIESTVTVEVPYMAVANVQDGSLKLDNVKTIEATPEEIHRYRLLPGDLLLTEGGDPDKLGRGAIWNGEIASCIHQNHIFRARKASEYVDMEYLAHLVSSPYGKRYFLRQSKQTTGIASINMGQLKRFPVPLPPLEEQRRIAAILDKRNLLEQQIRRRHALLDNLWKAEFVKRFGNPFANQSLCPFSRLAEIASTSSGGTPKREVGSYFGGSIPWVKSGELSNPLVEATEEFLTEDGLSNSSAKMLNPGVVLLAMYGATAGAVSILGIPACTNQAVCAIDSHGSLNSIFLADYLRLITPALLAKRIGGAQPNLTQDIIRNITVPTPGIDAQEPYIIFRKMIAKTAITYSRSSLAISSLGASCSRDVFSLRLES